MKREDLPADTLEKEKEIYRAQFAGQNKPANVIDKIVEGKLESYYAQVCLMDQPSVRDPNVTIKQMVAAATAKTGENVTDHAVRPLQARRNSRTNRRLQAVQGGRSRSRVANSTLARLNA